MNPRIRHRAFPAGHPSSPPSSAHTTANTISGGAKQWAQWRSKSIASCTASLRRWASVPVETGPGWRPTSSRPPRLLHGSTPVLRAEPRKLIGRTLNSLRARGSRTTMSVCMLATSGRTIAYGIGVTISMNRLLHSGCRTVKGKMTASQRANLRCIRSSCLDSSARLEPSDLAHAFGTGMIKCLDQVLKDVPHPDWLAPSAPTTEG